MARNPRTPAPVRAWSALRSGTLGCFLAGLAVTLFTIVSGMPLGWNHTGPAFMVVGVIGLIIASMVRASERRQGRTRGE